MANTVLKLACLGDYDRTRPLIDGRVRADGVDFEISVLRPREAFTRGDAAGARSTAAARWRVPQT
jgi:4,5-dihydroxyphthalate decarboxylase